MRKAHGGLQVEMEVEIDRLWWVVWYRLVVLRCTDAREHRVFCGLRCGLLCKVLNEGMRIKGRGDQRTRIRIRMFDEGGGGVGGVGSGDKVVEKVRRHKLLLLWFDARAAHNLTWLWRGRRDGSQSEHDV